MIILQEEVIKINLYLHMPGKESFAFFYFVSASKMHKDTNPFYV